MYTRVHILIALASSLHQVYFKLTSPVHRLRVALDVNYTLMTDPTTLYNACAAAVSLPYHSRKSSTVSISLRVGIVSTGATRIPAAVALATVDWSTVLVLH